MNVLSKLHDGRIDSDNYLVELSIDQYLDLVKDVLKQNEFQRRRVSSSKSIYSLLKKDIQRGCVIPPIVMALTSVHSGQEVTKETLGAYIETNKTNLVILDGLQRTYSLVDLVEDLSFLGDTEAAEQVKKQLLRVEIYVGINRIGILYRMLTLNTGQTPMSLRQQIEMLYLDYAKMTLNGITLLREVDTRPATGIGTYNFREIIEGFNSYLERNELPIERADLLENIKSLEKLAQENAQKDIFKDYVESWDSFIRQIDHLTNSETLVEGIGAATGWGKNAAQCFKRAQAVTGFGAAVGRLVDFKLIDGFDSVKDVIEKMEAPEDSLAFLEELNKAILWINSNSKKIGNAQRMFFQYYFRELLNPQNDQYAKPGPAVNSAFQKYLSQNT